VETAYAGARALLVASAVLSVALTTAGMALTGTEHSPACATIAHRLARTALGTGRGGGILVGVTVLYGVHTTLREWVAVSG
jgi:hypothetical protein